MHFASLRTSRIWTTALGAVLLYLALGCGFDAVAQDMDGDGWTVADGDCHDTPSGLCTSPELVNPGAFEIAGNGIDDDCDGVIDNATPVDCSVSAQFSGVDGLALAQALDLCQTTPASPPLPDRHWGVISAELLRAPGGGAPPDPIQVAVNTGFGSNILPRANATLAVLSTGTARDADEPGFMPPASGFEDPTNSTLPPADFVAAHGNKLISRVGCPSVSGTAPVFDMVLLRLHLRVPTNANQLQFDYAFLASQFPDNCTQFNDHFLALLYTTSPGIPADRNIAFDVLANPITTQTVFHQVCTPRPGETCPQGPAMLQGTGYDPADDGATAWLTSVAPVVPGEDITLDIYIFDVSDHQWDATALVDNLHWNVMPQAPLATTVEGGAPRAALHLSAPVPNPSRPSTMLSFVLPAAAHAELSIYDTAGRRLATLVDEELAAGEHRTSWSARDEAGHRVASGVYFARLLTSGQVLATRLVVLE